MNTQLKHWIVVLERIKTELLWKPYENDAATKIGELIQEMKEAVEEEYGGPICQDSLWSKLRQNTSIRENSSYLLV